MTISLQAYDTLFFGGGKPFNIGEDNRAQGIFPPAPSVLYGALQKHYLDHHPTEQTEAGIDALRKHLRIKNFCLELVIADEPTPLFPLPLDLMTYKDEQELLAYRLGVESISSENNSLGASALLLAKDQDRVAEVIEDGWLTKRQFQAYLANTPETIRYEQLSDLLNQEYKVGMARNRLSFAARENMLYAASMTRPATMEDHLNILLEVTGKTIETASFSRFGAEGKFVNIRKRTDVAIPLPTITDNRLKVILTTPCFFDAGAIPEWMQGVEPFTGKGLKVNLVAAAIGKYQSIGGFDVKKGQPKPMRRAVPAGSVYYLECEDAGALAETIHSKSIADKEKDQWQGFGIAYVGNW